MKQGRKGASARKMLGAACLATVLALAGAAADQADEISALFDRIESAWANQDVQAVAATCSESLVLAVDPPNRANGALVLNKEGYLRALTARFASGHSPKEHDIAQRDLALMGTIALVGLGTLDTFPDGRTMTSHSLVIAEREGDEWQVVFGLPFFFQPTATVTGAVPGSQGEAVGIQPGDRILAYAGEHVSEGNQFIEIVKRHADDPPDAQLGLEVARGAEELTLSVKPGTIGIDVSTRLLPGEGAALLVEGDDHQLIAAGRRVADAVCAQDAEAVLAIASPTAYIIATPGEDGRIRTTGPSQAREELERFWAWQAQSILDPASLECTRIAAIVKGNLGLVSCRFRFRLRDGEDAEWSNVYAFAREQGTWGLIATIPTPGSVAVEIGTGL